MLKKATAMFLVFASMAMWVSCVSTSSRYLYGALPGGSEIVAFREDPNSGVLTPLSVSPITAGPAVESIVLHPSKKFLYAANSGENDISLYTIASSGVLTEVTPRPQTGTTPTLLVMNSAGSFLYVANSGSNNISVFSIDASSGALTSAANPPVGTGLTPLNMALSPAGFLYVTVSGLPGNIEVWNLNAGVPKQVIQLAQAGTNPDGLVIHPNGKYLYTANAAPDNSISEFSINTDGTLTAITTVGVGALSGPVALLIDNSGKYLYAANQGASNLTGYTIGSNGSLSLLANYSVATNSKPSFMASDPSGKYLFVGNQSSPAVESFSLDTGNGTLTAVASYSLANATTSIAVTH